MSNLILRTLNQRPISYYPIYKDVTKSLQGGILLSQLMYWFSKKDKFFKTNEDIKNETHLTQHEMLSAKKAIRKLPFIKITREQIPAKTFYEIDWSQYEDFINQVVENPDNCIVDHLTTITKTTTKTTSNKLSKDNLNASGESSKKDFRSAIKRKIVPIVKPSKPKNVPKYTITTIDLRNYSEAKSIGATNHKADSKAECNSLDKIHALLSNQCRSPYWGSLVPKEYSDFKWNIDELLDAFKFQLAHNNKPIKSIGSFIFTEGYNGFESWSPLLKWHSDMKKGITGSLDEGGELLLKSLKQRKVENIDKLKAPEVNRMAKELLEVSKKHVFFNGKDSADGYAYGIISVASKYIKEKQNSTGFQWYWITKKSFAEELLEHAVKLNIMRKKNNGTNINIAKRKVNA